MNLLNLGVLETFVLRCQSNVRSALAFLIPIAAILGGCAVAITGVMARARVREAEIRERIAMIERGLVPSPEKDPQGFDRAMGHGDPAADARNEPGRYGPYGRRYSTPGKHRRGGFVLIGVGVGLMAMFAISGEQDGIGVGVLLSIIGAALFISSFFEGRGEAMPPQGPPVPSTQPRSGSPVQTRDSQ